VIADTQWPIAKIDCFAFPTRFRFLHPWSCGLRRERKRFKVFPSSILKLGLYGFADMNPANGEDSSG
jgi:hypothetical protein